MSTSINVLQGVQNNITATGATQAGAFPLSQAVNVYNVTTTAANTGVSLPLPIENVRYTIKNNGANQLTVYPFMLQQDMQEQLTGVHQ